MTLNAHYEENNFISEHLKFLHTPSYDTRTRGFFNDKDELGYQIALNSGKPGILMDSNSLEDAGQIERFQLDPVPLRRKSSVPSRVRSTADERHSLLLERDSNYLVMTAPQDGGESQPFLSAMPNSKSKENYPLNNGTYANLSQLQVSSDSRRTMLNSPKRSPNCVSFKDEDSIFTFSEIGGVAENDSVFGSEGIEEEDFESGKSDESKKQTNINNQPNGIAQGDSYPNKRDSGIYSPNILQNNPMYTPIVTFATSEKSKNLSNRISEKGDISRPMESFVGSSHERRKQRNQSDSSSGVGSYIDDATNSLEKYKCKSKEKFLIKPYIESECV